MPKSRYKAFKKEDPALNKAVKSDLCKADRDAKSDSKTNWRFHSSNGCQAIVAGTEYHHGPPARIGSIIIAPILYRQTKFFLDAPLSSTSSVPYISEAKIRSAFLGDIFQEVGGPNRRH